MYIKSRRKGDNLLLFGCDFYPDKRHHETNYWHDIAKYFARHFERVVVLSVNNRPITEEKLLSNVYLYNIRPYYFCRRTTVTDPEYSGNLFNKLPMSVIYKTISLINYLPMFSDLIKQHSIGIVHYFRVFGMLNSVLIRRFPNVLFSITVPTHIDRGFPMHYIYHIIKYGTMKKMGKIIATSEATKKRLNKLKIFKADQLVTIPWSIEICQAKYDDSELAEIKRTYSIDNIVKVVLWSGPLQDTRQKDFIYALDTAKGVTKKSDRYKFIFAFKPDKLKKRYHEMILNEKNISIIETSKSEFNRLISIADLFLSPIDNTKRTVAPPLTWIEMMQNGIPLITTQVDGVEELVIDGINGYIVENKMKAIEMFMDISEENLSSIKRNAMRITRQKYDIADIAEKYVKMWKSNIR